jgi:light-regulated signal transduction histidine kinase (bacteriophytochrome)
MGRTEMLKKPVDLGAMSAEVIESLAADIGARQIDWKVSALPPVTGDPAMLRQVLFNLISNAVKYTSTRARAEIEIGSQASGREVTFFVRDNGVGFNMQYVDKLFGVFQRLHSGKDFEGTGIGLATVRRIIHRHGGRTWAEGEVDKGAAFYFTLPLAEDHYGRVEENIAG